MDQRVIYLLMVHNFKSKRFWNISKDWTLGNTKKTGFNRYVHDF